MILYSRFCTDMYKKKPTLRTNVDVSVCSPLCWCPSLFFYLKSYHNHLFTIYQYILIWFLLTSGDQRERFIRGQFSSQSCMLFISLRVCMQRSIFTAFLFFFQKSWNGWLIRCWQLFVIRLWMVILIYLQYRLSTGPYFLSTVKVIWY